VQKVTTSFSVTSYSLRIIS